MRRLLCALALVLCAPVVRAQGPDPDWYYIHSISYGGNGCLQGTASQMLTPTRIDAVIGFDAFAASSGAGVGPSEIRKNCQININIHRPRFRTGGVVSVIQRGWAQLGNGLLAQPGNPFVLRPAPGAQDPTDAPTLTDAPDPRFLIGPLAKSYVAAATFDLAQYGARGGDVFTVPLQPQVRLIGQYDVAGLMTTDFLVIRILRADGSEGGQP